MVALLVSKIDSEEDGFDKSVLKVGVYNWIFLDYKEERGETMVLEENERDDTIAKESNPGCVPYEASMNMPSRSQAVGTSRTRLWCYYKQHTFLSNV